MSARVSANRGVLKRVESCAKSGEVSLSRSTQGGANFGPDVDPEASRDAERGLLPLLDQGLGTGHRFEMLGGIIRPVREFIRRTIDPDEEPDLPPSSRS
ncbi:MAG: hypothetical protein OSB09_10320 [Planctomycetota bacterium]|nr:hypothetical protein [Planctomycetota bacterium]